MDSLDMVTRAMEGLDRQLEELQGVQGVAADPKARAKLAESRATLLGSLAMLDAYRADLYAHQGQLPDRD